MIVACSAPPECFAHAGPGTYPDRNTTLFRSNRPIPNRRTPWMLLTDAFTIFPQRRKDWVEKQRTRWGEEESSWNGMHPYPSRKGYPRAAESKAGSGTTSKTHVSCNFLTGQAVGCLSRSRLRSWDWVSLSLSVQPRLPGRQQRLRQISL